MFSAPLVYLPDRLLSELVLAMLLLLGLSRNLFQIKKTSIQVVSQSSPPHDKRAIVHCILSGEASNAVQATKLINSIIPSTVSTQTVRNTLKVANHKAVTKKKEPLLSPAYRKKRLAFALKHQHWTVEDWKRVIWSDETKINRLGSDGQATRRKRSERHTQVWRRKLDGVGLYEMEWSGDLV